MVKKKMDKNAARRIQSHADRTGQNQDFKARAQRAAAKKKKIETIIISFNLESNIASKIKIECYWISS